MDYQKHYNLLISRAKSRTLTGYSERHHIIPRCMGGDDSKENLVPLTAEEHYIAHLLLVKMHPGNHRLLWAAMGMTNSSPTHQRRGNKLYGWLRRKFSEDLSRRNKGRIVSEESKAKMSAARLGKPLGPHSAETKAKMSSASKGKAKSESHKAALSAAKLGKKMAPRSDEWRKNQGAAISKALKAKGFAHHRSPEYRKKQAEKMKLVWAERQRQSNNIQENQ